MVGGRRKLPTITKGRPETTVANTNGELVTRCWRFRSITSKIVPARKNGALREINLPLRAKGFNPKDGGGDVDESSAEQANPMECSCVGRRRGCTSG